MEVPATNHPMQTSSHPVCAFKDRPTISITPSHIIGHGTFAYSYGVFECSAQWKAMVYEICTTKFIFDLRWFYGVCTIMMYPLGTLN